MRNVLRNTGRFRPKNQSSLPGVGWLKRVALSQPGKTGLAVFVAMGLCCPADITAQSVIAPENWATDMVQKSIREMEGSKHFKDARELANKSKARIDQRQGDLEEFLGAEYPRAVQSSEGLMAVIEEYDLFISSSLPLHTLRNYARDIDRLRREKGVAVRMVMRGFVDGMARIKPTIDFITNIIAVNPDASILDGPETYLVQVDIDPEKTMATEKVPALADKEGRCFVFGDSAVEDLISRVKSWKCEETVGLTEKIIEKNAIDEIQEAAAQVDTNRIQENMRKHMEASLENLPGQGLLPSCVRAESRKIVPEAVLDFDVPDPDHPGEILYPKGFRFNPLDYGQVHMKAFMFAGDRPEEVAFVNRYISESGQPPASYTLLALGGDYQQLVDQMDRAVYSGIKFVEQGWCQATPCLMTVKPGNSWIDVEELVAGNLQ